MTGRGRDSSAANTAGKTTRPPDRDGDRRTARERAKRAKKPVRSDDESRQALANSKKLYYRIGEVSELTGVKAHVLRYWETEFRWMAPPKSRSKQRLYRKRDIEFVWLLKMLLWDQRYTIAGARQRIQDLGLDEALARAAVAESLDLSLGGALGGALGDSLGESLGVVASRNFERGDSDAEVENPSPHPSVDEVTRQDWLGLRVALDGMQGELIALRGALQQGL